MTYGIIPDIHQKVETAVHLIDRLHDIHRADHIIMLGDYMDDFDDTPAMTYETLRQVGIWQKRDDMTLLMGNHEAAYMNPEARCTGWSPVKQVVWDECKRARTFQPDDLRACKVLENNLLFSHAGLPKGVDLTDQVRAISNLRCWGEWDRAELDYHHRDGGSNQVGSLLTARPQYNDLNAVYKQVFGHTPQAIPMVKRRIDGSFWWCNLDTNLKHYMVIDVEDGEEFRFSIHPV